MFIQDRSQFKNKDNHFLYLLINLLGEEVISCCIYDTKMQTKALSLIIQKKTKFHSFRTGGIPARTANGQRLLLYVGIIDILQSYHMRKKLEHTLKSVITDGVRL